MKRRRRKQHVALRHRRRDVIKGKVQSVLRRSVILAVAAGVVFGLRSKGEAYLSVWLHDFTPQIEVLGPSALSTLSVRAELPANPITLWLPWSGRSLEMRILEKFTSVRQVRVERDFSARRIRVRLDPRQALALVGDRCMDREGVLFPNPPGAQTPLPELALAGTLPRRVIGAWLQSLVSNPLLWQRITALREDKDGLMWVMFRSGTEVWWGNPDPSEVRAKGTLLLNVLEDAQQNLHGAARADLRFFSEGRIIVKPRP